MAFIHLTTFIAAPQERVFDLSRSVRLHKESMEKYKETITDGIRSGLMNAGDTVTWKARHLMKERIMKVKITEMKRPDFFVDEQVYGDFKFMKHEHYFKPIQNGIFMIDQFRFDAGNGWLTKLAGKIILERYMTRLLEERNAHIKRIAESNQWQQFIDP